MSVHETTTSVSRLRGSSERGIRQRQIDAEVYRPPRFSVLMLLAALAALLQATWLHRLGLRDAHVDLLTVLIVWTGLRGGVVFGGALGLIGGMLEDALGGGGANVLGSTLVGFAAGLLSNRFFSDSLPVFVSAVAAGTVVRGAVAYAVTELALGARGTFHRVSHALFWEVLLNCAVAAIALLWLRVRSHLQPARRQVPH